MTDDETDDEDKPLKIRGMAKSRDLMIFWKICTGDRVQVMTGLDRGKRGRVMECNKSTNYLKVRGCMLVSPTDWSKKCIN